MREQAHTQSENLQIDFFTFSKDGYVQIFVASESEVDTWFDDLEIIFKPSLIAQETHYDPWGLELLGIEKQGKPEHEFKYNGKELQSDLGLNWYDYGARFYDPQLARWHVVDALAAKAYNWTPFRYGFNNPLKFIDKDGNWEDSYYTSSGKYLGMDTQTSDNIRIMSESTWNSLQQTSFRSNLMESNLGYLQALGANSVGFNDAELSPEAMSSIFTNILSKMPDVDISQLHNGMVSISNGFSKYDREIGKSVPQGWNNPGQMNGIANTNRKEGSASWLKSGAGYTESGSGVIKVTAIAGGNTVDKALTTISGVQNILGAHEFLGHGVFGYGFNDKTEYDINGTHNKAYLYQMNHSSWGNMNSSFQNDILDNYEKYRNQIGK